MRVQEAEKQVVLRLLDVLVNSPELFPGESEKTAKKFDKAVDKFKVLLEKRLNTINNTLNGAG